MKFVFLCARRCCGAGLQKIEVGRRVGYIPRVLSGTSAYQRYRSLVQDRSQLFSASVEAKGLSG